MTTTQPVQPGQIRIGDLEREQMAERLSRAHAAGQLQLDEFDERVKKAYEARVQTELDALALDLPDEHLNGDRGFRGDGRNDGARAEGAGGGARSVRHPQGAWRGGMPPHWRAGGPARWRGRSAQCGGGVPRAVWITLAVVLALWAIGPLVGFLFRAVFTVAIIAGIVVLVGKVRERRR